MGNMPAKITGKYQSYDINTPHHVTPPLTLKKQQHAEQPIQRIQPEPNYQKEAVVKPKLDSNRFESDINKFKNVEKEVENEFNDNESSHSSRNSHINEHPVDVSHDSVLRGDSENEDYIEDHVQLQNKQRQVDVMY